jgi:hypothetical protein
MWVPSGGFVIFASHFFQKFFTTFSAFYAQLFLVLNTGVQREKQRMGRMPKGKNTAFRGWVGSKINSLKERFRSPVTASAQPVYVQGTVSSTPMPPEPKKSLHERLDDRFETLMQEVDELSSEKYSPEEHVEYFFLSVVRMVLPLLFFAAFGYEDGLFMTGFRDFTWAQSFIVIMYGIGYGLESLRTALVYSMSFSKTEQRSRAFKQQIIFWSVMSVGCGIAQLAAAVVIQAMGSSTAIDGSSSVSQGAAQIMLSFPWLIYLAIGVRVVLCAVADAVCSGFLHKKRETVEQKVVKISTRAANIGTVVQANLNAQTMIDNAKQYQDMMHSQNVELKELREQQKAVWTTVYNAGMSKVNEITEVPAGPALPAPGQDASEAE